MSTGEIIISSVLTSFSASLLFFLMMALFRPRMKLSTQIASHWQQQLKQTVFQVKLYNRSWIPAIDIKVEAILVDRQHHNHGILLHTTELKFVRCEISKLNGFRSGDKEAKYAWRMTVLDDLSAMWTSPTQYLELTVKARHPWSGFPRWFINKYYLDTNPIVPGRFKTGKSMDIV